jgi:hypothetical protein
VQPVQGREDDELRKMVAAVDRLFFGRCMPTHSRPFGPMQDPFQDSSWIVAQERLLKVTISCLKGTRLPSPPFLPHLWARHVILHSATTPGSLDGYLSLEQVFQILMGYFWMRFYPSGAALDSVETSQLRSSKAKFWLLKSMEAIWIVHCSEPLNDQLRTSLEAIARLISCAFNYFQEYIRFEVVHDPIIPMMPGMKGEI